LDGLRTIILPTMRFYYRSSTHAEKKHTCPCFQQLYYHRLVDETFASRGTILLQRIFFLAVDAEATTHFSLGTTFLGGFGGWVASASDHQRGKWSDSKG